MTYDAQLNNLRALLPGTQKILIALPVASNIDKLASGLALYLSLTQQGKDVSIVCQDDILVGLSHLFAIDKVQKTLVAGSSGDYILTLSGVASQNTVPSLEKLDYYVEGQDLNLVFKVLPGQSFNPTNIAPKPQTGGNFGLVFVIGATSLNDLGSVYTQNIQSFSGAHIVNIDTQSTNTNFGQTNIVDSSASSVSEMIASIMTSLGMPSQEDISTNLITGIFDATGNLTSPKVTADTYQIVATCLKNGGRRPGESVQSTVSAQPATSSQPLSFGNQPAATFDLSALMPADNSTQDSFTVPPVVNGGSSERLPNDAFSANTPSQEERPMGEGVVSEAEPDWLTPKIFKGSSIG